MTSHQSNQLLREADKRAMNKISDVHSMDEALAVFDERLAAHKQALLNDLLEAAVEYLDCKESPEQNWQNCACENVKAVPVETIKRYMETRDE